jgi:hypothetical protein
VIKQPNNSQLANKRAITSRVAYQTVHLIIAVCKVLHRELFIIKECNEEWQLAPGTLSDVVMGQNAVWMKLDFKVQFHSLIRNSDDYEIRSASALVISFVRLTHFDFDTYAVSCKPFNSAESCGLDAHSAAVVVKSDSVHNSFVGSTWHQTECSRSLQTSYEEGSRRAIHHARLDSKVSPTF